MITPHSYQLEAVTSARKALLTTNRALIVLASGLGKMLTSAFVWKDFRPGRGLFLVHTNEILDHAIKEYGRVYNGARKALFNGFNKEIEDADIIFSSFQTMRNSLHKFPRDYFSWMTVDENHHAQADTYRPVVEYFDCPRLGVTATPDREDLLDIRDLFGNEVYNLPLEEAIARGLLPNIEYHLMTGGGLNEQELEQIAREVIDDGRRVSLGHLNRRLFVPTRDECVAEIIESQHKKGIVFCNTIAHTTHFRRFLNNAATYHAHTFRKDKKTRMDQFRAGTLSYLLAVNCFNEGVDFPDVDLVVFYRTTDSDTIFRQQLGRGLRPGKEKLVVLDFVGNLERILMLKRMSDRIKVFQRGFVSSGDSVEREWKSGDAFNLDAGGLKFNFSDQIVNLMQVLSRIDIEFYATWQEASAATIALDIKNWEEYRKRYTKDPRLPSNPQTWYLDYPGVGLFFGRIRDRRNFYSTWREASRAAIKLGIGKGKSVAREYMTKYSQDPRLPSNPNRTYRNFPGWTVFGGGSYRDHYPTWQEAGRAARKLKIRTIQEYAKRHQEDRRLPASPYDMYKDFPGFQVFINHRARP